MEIGKVANPLPIWHSKTPRRPSYPRPPSPTGCGCSSVVEHDLAKVGVEGSNPFARSRILGKAVIKRQAAPGRLCCFSAPSRKIVKAFPVRNGHAMLWYQRLQDWFSTRRGQF